MTKTSVGQIDQSNKLRYRSSCGRYMRKYSEKEILAEAKKYDTRGKFRAGAHNLYRASIEYGLHEKSCSHMRLAGNSYRRYVYKLSNDFGEVYYGLTCNLHTREIAHRLKPKLIEPFRFEAISDLLSAESAAEMERTLIAEARQDMFIDCKNTKDGGELGGAAIKWTLEALQIEANKYTEVSEFQKNSPSADTVAHRRGWHSKICSHMTKKRKPNGYWKDNPDRIKKEALKYKHRAVFERKSSGAYGEAMKTGMLDVVCSHMTAQRKTRTPDEVVQECKAYATQTILTREAPDLISAAKRFGVWPEASAHMIGHWEYKRTIASKQQEATG